MSKNWFGDTCGVKWETWECGLEKDHASRIHKAVITDDPECQVVIWIQGRTPPRSQMDALEKRVAELQSELHELRKRG